MSMLLADSKYKGTLLLFGMLPYRDAIEMQKTLWQERLANGWLDTLVLLEHDPVVTLGRTTKAVHWREGVRFCRERGISIYESERGGSVTYHGPGQIVAYPILRLRQFCSGPKRYMRMLEEVVIRVLREWGIEAHRREKLVGVWVHDPTQGNGVVAKIASMGVKISRGITMHGFALNVSVDLEPFQWVVPCGIDGCQVTSMSKVLGRDPHLETVRGHIANHFAQVFGIEWKEQKEGSGSLSWKEAVKA